MAMSVFLTAGILTIGTVLGQADSVQSLEPNQRGLIIQGQSSLENRNGDCNVSRTFPCACYRDRSRLKGLAIDCSRRNLSFVPFGIPVEATQLDISHNNLKNLTSGVFRRLTRLETLDLSNNDIKYFATGIFLGLTCLRTLCLNDNSFNLTPTAFADDVFKPLTNLAYLNLKFKAGPGNLQGQYPDVALGQLHFLETLLITGLSSTSFGAGVQNMTSLKTLDLSGSPDFISLSNNTFKHFKNIKLTTLNLSFCDLRWIDRETFVELPFINTIDYSFNRKLGLTGFGNSTFGLRNSTIRKIIAQRLTTRDSLTVLTREDVQYLQNTRLEEFYGQHNSIAVVEEGAIESLPLSLKVLNISWNDIQTYRSEIFQLLRLRNAEVLDVSYQETYQLGHPDFASHKTGLWKNVSVVRQGSPKEDTPKLEHFAIRLPPNLWRIECSHTYKLSFTIPHFELINSSLKFANFANNLLSRWEGPIVGIEKLEHVDLSGNNCEFVSQYFLGYGTGLKTLLIGNNHLGPELDDLTFHNLSSLRHLGMGSNRLEDVGTSLFSSLSNLRSLNLSGNYLSNWNADISGLRHLAELDLSHNKLTSLPQGLLGDLDAIWESTPVQLDIHGNQFDCTCQTKDFVHWLTITKVKLKNLNSTSCTLGNGTKISLTKSRSIWKHLDLSCRSYGVLLGVLSGCLVIILVIVCGAVIHRYRWKLRYLYYMAANRRERTGYQRLDSTEDKPFGFDAFVCYEDSDRPFIIEHVIPRLEDEVGLKLCIDKRDFIPGLYITDNIMNAIQNSRKTVVLLSRQFLKSKWCMYELNMARMEGIYSDRRLLIVVLLEEIPTAILAAEVLEVIHDQTYIERTENEYGQAVFFERLTEAIKSDV